MDGQIHIGLDDNELRRVAETVDAVKVSRRDIAYAICKGVVGGTTVAATIYLANLVGIRVFATGGIGGVHREAEKTFDISADLLEIANTPISVVCAGVKSILDISKTVEFLDTHSINCIVYGEENVFPGFFTRKSDSKGQYNTLDLAEVVQHIETSKALGMKSGTVLACPIPKEVEGDGCAIEAAVQKALTESKERNIQSKDITPFLLSRVNELTSGKSMTLNIALLENNAQIAGNLATLLSKSKSRIFHLERKINTETGQRKQPKIVVIGATIVDFESVTQEEVEVCINP
ncbi:indigoidine synthase A-like protein [Dictyocaulus viviparus]|uniref:Indigoidine synthase A-like protein n=1 Tax=Dictyocaulus viviparus TaxID=29172 RepID=A0A0D8XX97_DICVI|nr:indigoidine synthase A-like protein [Dictyocaulus viviparus]